MFFVVIDTGSIDSMSIESVILYGNYLFITTSPTSWGSCQTVKHVYSQLVSQSGYIPEQINYLVVTGYGQVAVDFASHVSCLSLVTDFVVDIGVQNSNKDAAGDGGVFFVL